MNTISTPDVVAIARLGRLGLSETELARATTDLTNVLDHFSRLQAIDTTNVPISADMAGLKNITRTDTPEREVLCSTDDLLIRAEAISDRLVSTPSVRT